MVLVETLERWEAAGGHWRVLERAGGVATVGLCSCDGGEEMHRVRGPESADLIGFLGGRADSTA